MDKLSVDDLVKWLRQSCPDVENSSLDLLRGKSFGSVVDFTHFAIIVLIREHTSVNRISGRGAQTLSLEGLHTMGVSYGDSMDIIESLKKDQVG